MALVIGAYSESWHIVEMTLSSERFFREIDLRPVTCIVR